MTDSIWNSNNFAKSVEDEVSFSFVIALTVNDDFSNISLEIGLKYLS